MAPNLLLNLKFKVKLFPKETFPKKNQKKNQLLTLEQPLKLKLSKKLFKKRIPKDFQNKI
jgi:hypothetical protein